MATYDEVRVSIEDARSGGSRSVIGISGYGGAGKSTLARRLEVDVVRSARVRGDDFMVPALAGSRSGEWSAVERIRLRREVLEPFRAGRASRFRRWDWVAGTLRRPEPLPDVQVLLVDAVGLFHPELLDVLDLRIWVDVDLETSSARGRARDRARIDDHDRLWTEVWVPNERDFDARYDPRSAADLRYVPES